MTESELFTKQALCRLVLPLFLDQILLLTVGILATRMLGLAFRTSHPSAIENSLYQLGRILVINVVALFGTSPSP